MFLTLLGFILIMSPFLALKKFKNPIIGFFHITLLTLFIQLIIAFISQTLHIFNYPVVLVINIIVFITCLFLFRPRKISFNLKLRPDFSLVFVVLVGFLALFSAHYYYIGTYSTVTNPVNQAVAPFSYQYPYFSDEWYAVAFIKDAINTHSLPVKNPIWHGKFTNLEMPFHSLLAETTMLLKLNPITGYVHQSIAINLFIIVLIYYFLVLNKIRRPLSAIASLFALYIANAGLLPGLWTLLPLSLGIVFLLLTLAFYNIKNQHMFVLASFLTLVFYPPLAIFIFTLMLFQLFGKSLSISLRLLLFYAAIVGTSAALIAILFLFDTTTIDHILGLIIGRLFYTTFIGNNFISSFPIYFVLPIPVLILSVFGLYRIFREQKALLGMIIISLIFWIYYTFTPYRFIIEFERVVVVAAILLVVTSGFGLKTVFCKLEKFKFINLIYLERMILLIFLPLLLFYTRSDSWSKFTAHSIGSDVVSTSRPLPNQYINSDDLKLFANIKNKQFLAPAWKGTVISIATDNYPLAIKDGTISQDKQNFFSEFMSISCIEKQNLVEKTRLDYVYTPMFECPGFEIVGESAEGLILYKTDQ